MFKNRTIILFIFLALLVTVTGCVKTSATDQSVIDEVQVFLDTPADPSNPDLLTVEERARIEGFTITHNIVKTMLVQETDQIMWEVIGRKMVTAYAEACRRNNVLESAYYGQIFIDAEFEGKIENFMVGDFLYHNRNDRIEVQLYNPTD